jgi:phage head maturation protease
MVSGYAVVYGALSVPGVRGECSIEEICVGAFRESIRRAARAIPITVNHGEVIATTEDGRLRIFDDEFGVRFQLRGYRLPAGFTGMSFRFRGAKVKRRGILRRVMSAELTELCICVRPHEPAFEVTRFTVKES